MRISFLVLLAGLAACATAAAKPAAQGPHELVLRHALTGESAALLISLAERFNADGRADKVIVQHLSMVPDPHQLPHMALLDDDEYQKFFDGRPRMMPLHKVMADARERLDSGLFFPVVSDVVDDHRGRLRALPLALSVPVLFYNKDAFRKAKLDPQQPPRTWWELQTAAGKLFDAGYRCPFTTSNPAWVQIENLTTQHNEPLANGERGGKTNLALNSLIQVKHVALLSSWHKSFYLHFFGRGREADEKFANGACTILTSDSSLYSRLSRSKAFDFGVAELPHYDDVRGSMPGRVLPDGPALWLLAGKKAPEYKVAAQFVAFLLRAEVQKEWVRGTGFLPMMPVAVDTGMTDGATPAMLRRVVQRLSDRKLATAARPKSVLGLDRVRAIINEELEAVWANRKPAKEALDTAVLRGNAVLHPAPADGATR